MNPKPFILVTEDNEYLADSSCPKLTLNIHEACVYGRTGTPNSDAIIEHAARHSAERSITSRRFYVATVETDADFRAVKRIAEPIHAIK